MRIAIIADIHGNAPALEAVLEYLGRGKYDRVIDLGDAFNGPIDPAAVVKMLRAQPIVHVRGNGERMVLSEDAQQRTRSATFARDRLGPEDLAWFSTWPMVQVDGEIVACHGSPTSDVDYLLEEIAPQGVRLRAPADIAARISGFRAPMILCGHTHIPRYVRVDDQVSVVNPGSVGLPAYADAAPIPHHMETGSPAARFAVAERGEAGWHVTHYALRYDHEKAARAAEREGFPDWAHALRTGYAE